MIERRRVRPLAGLDWPLAAQRLTRRARLRIASCDVSESSPLVIERARLALAPGNTPSVSTLRAAQQDPYDDDES
jgi:hypothetical protein